MGKPNPRSTVNQVQNPPSNKKKVIKVKSTKVKEPSKIIPNVSNPTDDIGLHSIVGHLNLDPYVWITLAGDDDNLATRNGLKSLHITNEESKYPRVSFSLFVPDYRDEEESQKGKDYFIPSEPGRPISKFHVGAVFYVKWGYKTNHDTWGPFRVTERSISFEEGTALLRVTGLIAARLKTIITAEIFNNTPQDSAIHKMARKAGISVNTQYLTSEERERLFSDTKPITTKGDDLGQVIYKKCRELDIDMRFSTDGKTLFLVTPFKSLIRKKPFKLTYGYPTSNISSIDIQTKHPIKKGQSPNFVARLAQPMTRSGGRINETTLRILVHGPLQYTDAQGQRKEYIAGGFSEGNADGIWIFSTYKTKDDGTTDTSSGSSASNAIANAQKKWKPEEGYRVSAVQGGQGRNRANENTWAVLVEREIKLSGVVTQEEITYKNLDDFFNRSQQARTLGINQIKEVFILKTNTQAPDDSFEGIKYTLGIPQEGKDEKQDQPKAPKQNSTVEAVPSVSEDTMEGYEFLDVKGDGNSEDITTTSIQTSILRVSNTSKRRLGEQAQKAKEAYDKHVNTISNRVLASNGELGIRTYEEGGFTVTQLTKKVREDPSATNSESDKSTEVSDTSTGEADKPNSSFTPASLQSGVGRPSRRITTTDLNIKLKAGDYHMKVGEHIRLDNLHRKLDGLYFIYKEEHTIDINGFHTTVSCKRAVGTLRNQFGNQSSTYVAEGQSSNTRQAVGQEQAEKVQVIDVSQSNQIQHQVTQALNEAQRANEVDQAAGTVNPRVIQRDILQ